MRRKTKQNDEKKSAAETRCAKKTKRFLFSFLAFHRRPEQCAAEFLAGRPFSTVLTGFCEFSTRRLSRRAGKIRLETSDSASPGIRIQTQPSSPHKCVLVRTFYLNVYTVPILLCLDRKNNLICVRYSHPTRGKLNFSSKP